MKKVKAKHKTDPTQILLGKFSLDFLNRRNNKEHEKLNNKKKRVKITTEKLLLLRFIVIKLNWNIPIGSIYTWKNKSIMDACVMRVTEREIEIYQTSCKKTKSKSNRATLEQLSENSHSTRQWVTLLVRERIDEREANTFFESASKWKRKIESAMVLWVSYCCLFLVFLAITGTREEEWCSKARARERESPPSLAQLQNVFIYCRCCVLGRLDAPV